jgi:hypothetical protein
MPILSLTALTAKIFFRRLDRNVAEQKLDLVQIPSGIAAEPSARPAEVMRCQFLNGCSLGAVLYNMPYDALSYAFSPSLACSANARKDAAFAHAS